jgi:hypothetical protein
MHFYKIHTTGSVYASKAQQVLYPLCQFYDFI